MSLLYVPEAHSIPQFQLRFSPALAQKPKAPPKSTPSSKPFDPFASPPASLRVSGLGPAHYLVLNKFAVVPEHFILATVDFRPQTHVLDEADLAATLACIKAYEKDQHEPGTEDEGENDGLFAFFNCGPHSGASQPHRHIQLLPVSRMKDGLSPDADWAVLADSLASRPASAPFSTFAEKITLETPSSDLHAAYLRLYRQACRAVAQREHSGEEYVEPPLEGETVISYNMAVTKNTLVICPRLAEGVNIYKDGQAVGTLSLNGTVLAGTALVKNEAEWNALREDSRALSQALRGIGL